MSKSTTIHPGPDTHPRKQAPADVSVEELKDLLREAEKALGDIGSYTAEQVHALRDRLQSVLADGKVTLKNLAAAARRHAGHADEVIRANPYQTAGIAAGVGVLTGYLISRSCSRR
jgi:ElaB/YqjD/DUF883 family membrane-anchored ribosome-binding protein